MKIPRTSKPVLIAALVLLALTTLGSLEARTFQPFTRGDANQNGSVDISDAQVIFLHIYTGGGAVVRRCKDASDANDDGALNLADGIFLLDFIFRGGVAPAAPGVKGCGYDRTGGALGCSSFAPCPVEVFDVIVVEDRIEPEPEVAEPIHEIEVIIDEIESELLSLIHI